MVKNGFGEIMVPVPLQTSGHFPENGGLFQHGRSPEFCGFIPGFSVNFEGI